MFCTRRWTLLLALAATGAPAQAEGPPWMLSLSALRDENAYEHAVGSLHLGIGEQSWLSLAIGSMTAPSAETDVSAALAAVDLEHDFGPAGIAVGVESWGDADNLEATDLRGELFFSGDRYRVALAAERRDIDIYFSGDGAPRVTDLRRFGVDADGLGLNARVRFGPKWQVYGSWMEYDYPRRIGLVPRADRLNLLSTSTVTLAYSFVDRYTTLGFEKAFNQVLLNIDLGRDRSTLDQSELKSISAALLFPVATRLDVEVAVGNSRLDGGRSTLFGGLSLLLYGGG